MTKRDPLVLAVLAAALWGCPAEATKTSGAPGAGTEPTPATAAPGASTAAKAVARIVFVGQKQACECTRKRIDDTWQALQQTLGDPPKIPVERLQRDVDEEKADRYDEMRSLMVAPGLYLLDEDGTLIELLQGEVSSEQLSQALAPSGA